MDRRPLGLGRLLVEVAAGLLALALACGAGVAAAWAVSARPQPWRATAEVGLVTSVPPSPAVDLELKQAQGRYLWWARQPGLGVQAVRDAQVTPAHVESVTARPAGTRGVEVVVDAVHGEEADRVATAAAVELADLVRADQARSTSTAADRLVPVVGFSAGPAVRLTTSGAVLVGFGAAAAMVLMLPIALLLTAGFRAGRPAQPRPAGGLHRAWFTLAALLGVMGANALVLSDARVPVVVPAAGLWACLGAPAFLVYGANPFRLAHRVERLVTSVLAVVLLVMLVGLTTSLLSAPLRISHPLGSTGVLLTSDVLVLLLAAALHRRHPRYRVLPTLQLGARDLALPLLAALAVLMAVMGATRLDNGAGGGLAHTTLVVVALGLALLYRWRERVTGGALHLSAYGLGLALLLMTSLRGDGPTGHDVQHEMYVFLSTLTSGVYQPHGGDPYNACLSITVLPTVLVRWTQLADPSVFKVLFQALYALCPLLVLRIGARLAGPAVGVVSYVWFVGFLGFQQDMPMLNRQEVGFLFFAGALLLLLADELPMVLRRTGFAVLASGMVLSHYSTTYFAVGALATAYGLQVLLRLALRSGRGAGWALLRTSSARPWPLALGLVLYVGAASALWTGPVTGTLHGLTGTVSRTVDAVNSSAAGARSGEAQYAVVPVSAGTGNRQAQAYTALRQAVGALRQAAPQAFYPDAPVAGPDTTPAVAPGQLPLSAVGRRLAATGLDVPALNKAVRVGSAVLLQLLVVAGVAAVVLARRREPLRQVEGVLLALGVLALTGLQVVLPELSLEYGVARSFMQSLMVLGPFLAVGCGLLVPVRWAARRLVPAVVLAVAFFLSSDGALTQALGGYGPQLHLDNAGDYYDRYYSTASEDATLQWVRGELVLPRGVYYPNLQMDPALFNKSGSVFTRAYPLRAFTLLQPAAVFKDAYVVLSVVNVRAHKSLYSVAGYPLWYDFQEPFLASHKNLVFATEDTRIYR